RPEANARQRCAPSGANVFGVSSSRGAASAASRRMRPVSAPSRRRLRLLLRVRRNNRTTQLFDNLSEKLGGILDRLTRRGALTEADVDAAMREVRRALLEADVSLD